MQLYGPRPLKSEKWFGTLQNPFWVDLGRFGRGGSVREGGVPKLSGFLGKSGGGGLEPPKRALQGRVGRPRKEPAFW